MTGLTKPPSCFIGCDVGKTNIVVFDGRDRRISTIANQAADGVAYDKLIGAPGSQIVKPFREAVRDSIVAQIKTIDAAIHDVVRDHTSLKKSIGIPTSICGIGTITAAALIGLMPESNSRGFGTEPFQSDMACVCVRRRLPGQARQ